MVLQILGSDFNGSSIQYARHAKYSAWSLRALHETKRSLYFHENSDSWEVKPTYRAMVDFRLEDLLKVDYFEEFDFILCRNVFIYLNEETKQRILETFAKALRPCGYLLLGHSEAGLVIPKSLKANNHSSFLYYAKSPSNEILPSHSMEPSNIIPDTELLRRVTYSNNSLQIAIQLANLGKLKDARESCLSILSKEEDNYEALYWLGYILEAEGDYLSAEMQYEKSLKIKEDFLETYISLSSLYTVLGRDLESESVKKACLKVLSERCDLQTKYERKGLDMNKLQRYLETKKEIWVA
jgi:chemotaxis protein methyltransferase CheR